MGLLDLLKESQAAAPKKRTEGSNEPRLKIIDMSRRGYTRQDGTEVPTNRGTIKFLPILSLNEKPVKYAYDVLSYNYENEEEGYTRWYRLMDSKDYDSVLSDEDKALILKGRSMIRHCQDNLGWDFQWVENKNYAFMFGYVLEHTSSDGVEIINRENRTAALIVFPSKNFAKAMTDCLTKIQGYGDEIGEEMYADLFSRNTERENFLTITFDRSSGFGYDVLISADSIDRKCVKILTQDELKEQKIQIPEDQMKFFTNHAAVFFAGNRDTTDDAEEFPDFDAAYCESVLSQIQAYIDKGEQEEKAAENLPPIPSKNKKKRSDLDSDEE